MLKTHTYKIVWNMNRVHVYIVHFKGSEIFYRNFIWNVSDISLLRLQRYIEANAPFIYIREYSRTRITIEK